MVQQARNLAAQAIPAAQAGYATVGLVRPGPSPAPVDAADWVRGDLSDHAFVKEATEGCCSIIDLACQLVPPCDSIEQQLANDGGVLDACLFAGLAHGAQVIFTSGNFSIPTKNR